MMPPWSRTVMRWAPSWTRMLYATGLSLTSPACTQPVLPLGRMGSKTLIQPSARRDSTRKTWGTAVFGWVGSASHGLSSTCAGAGDVGSVEDRQAWNGRLRGERHVRGQCRRRRLRWGSRRWGCPRGGHLSRVSRPAGALVHPVTASAAVRKLIAVLCTIASACVRRRGTSRAVYPVNVGVAVTGVAGPA